MRDEALYLDDILEAGQQLQRFLNGVREEKFLEDDLLQSAVLQKLTVIGEAAARLRSNENSVSADQLEIHCRIQKYSGSRLLRARLENSLENRYISNRNSFDSRSRNH